jgi:hypothetical protein
MGPLFTPSPCGPLILPHNSCPLLLHSRHRCALAGSLRSLDPSATQPRAASPDQFVSNTTAVQSFIHSSHAAVDTNIPFWIGQHNAPIHHNNGLLFPDNRQYPRIHDPSPPRLVPSFPLRST